MIRATALSFFACTLLVGCPEGGETSAPTPSAAPTAADTGAPQASGDNAAASQPAKPVCESLHKKVWSENANPRTGLTATDLGGGKHGVGVAFGNRPHRLVIDAKGEPKVEKINLGDDDPLSKTLQGKDVRHLQRITVTNSMSFADYRDKVDDGGRRVACGPINAEPYLVFDGKPLLEDVDDSGKNRIPIPALASALPVASATPPDAVPVSQDADVPRELRDCRTFSDGAANDVWSVGSEIVGFMKDGTRHWNMEFFVKTDAGKGNRILLYRQYLGEKPEKLHTLEAPVAHRLSDGSYVLAGRYQGRMFTWLLGADKSKKGDLQRYAGGYPSLPRVLPDGDDHLLLTSQKVDLSHWKLRALRLQKPSRLMQALLEPHVGEDQPSAAEPTFARIGDQRWLSFHSGERREGRITLVPVDENLKEVGKSFVVTPDGTDAYESLLFGTASGELVSVYISRPGPGKGAQLITERLRCSVQPEN